MKKYFLIPAIIYTKTALASSALYSENEEIKEILNDNMYEPNYFSMILGLFIVIGLIYLTGIIYQKLTKIKLQEEDEDEIKVRIISSTPLGQGKALHIIKVNDEYSLIGSTQETITHIKELDIKERKEHKENK